MTKLVGTFPKYPNEIIYFFQDFPGYNEIGKEQTSVEDLNYSFLAKLFTSLSDQEKEKILQVLKNTRALEKTG